MLNLVRNITLVTAAVVLSGCYGQSTDDRERGEGEEQGIPAVEAVQVQRGTLPLEERLAGSVVSRNQTEIFAEVGGRIVEVLANDGDRVESGAPLVRLRDTEFEEQLQQAIAGLQVAEARVKQAEANNARMQAALRRTETIVERNLGSAAELEVAQAEALSAEAELQLMRAERQQAESLAAERRSALGETVIRAPITGIVGGRNAEVGQVATTSTPLFVIGDPASMRVTITLTQRMLGYIETGTRVNIFTDATSGEAIEASISRISPFLHPVTRTTNAEIDIDQADGVRLRPGMFVTVDVLYGESQLSALVPNNAIYAQIRDGREGVYLASLDEANKPLEGDTVPVRSDLDPAGPVAVRFAPVTVVARGRQATAVEGVEPGQWVVTVGHHLLAAGDIEQAVVQPTPWEHIMRLQQMQTRDLLEMIQRRQGELADDLEALN